MSQLFLYKGKYYGSVPTLPIKIGADVLVVFKTVGLVRHGMQYIKHVGKVTHIFYPDTLEHNELRVCDTEGYVVPEFSAVLIKVAFGGGKAEIFLPKDVVHVVWIPVDSVPNLDDANMFNLY